MIEGREAAGEREGRLIRYGGRDADAEMLGDMRHGRDQQHRIELRNLCPAAQRRVGRSGINVVNTDAVGDEDRVELAGLENARHVRPVIKRIEVQRAVLRMAP